MINRATPPPIKDAVDFSIRLSAYEKYELDNAIPVYMVPSSTQDTMLIDIVFPAGNWFESESLQSAATAYLLKSGTLRHSALAINEAIDFYGAFLNYHSNHDYASYTLHCLGKHIMQLLPTLREIILEPIFPEAELELYKQNRKQKLAVNLQKCEVVANRKIDEYLFGAHHPYGRHSTMEAYDALQRDSLREFYKKYYAGNQCKIFVAGNVPANIIAMLNDAFGKEQWNNADEIIANDIPLQPAAQKKYRIANDEKGVQGAVRVARLFPNRYHPDFPGMLLLNTIFGGYFGSRLMSNIREEKGYTYGIHSSLYNLTRGGAFSIETEAGKAVCEATIKEIFREMEILKNELVSEEELSLVRNYMLGSILGSLDGAFKIIQRWKNLIINGLDENYFYNQIHIFKTISAAELQELAQRYFVPEDFYELVVV